MSRLLYLDTDVVVKNSLESCATLPMTEHIAAAQEKTFGRSNCKTFFARMGVSLDSPYFNAGVLLIDCNRWTASQTRLQLLEAAAKTGWNLPSGDQTLLNYHFQGRFDRLSPDWNCLAYAAAEPPSGSDRARIVHFIGRPKPWECGGWLNRQYPLYQETSRPTSVARQCARVRVLARQCLPNGSICTQLYPMCSKTRPLRRGVNSATNPTDLCR